MDPSARPPLDPPALDAARLGSPGPDVAAGLRVEVVAEAGSTNALVAERARGGAAEGLVVVAEHQTAGRGRLDRSWVTPPRSALTFSVLLRPSVPLAGWTWIPLLAGHEVARALRGAGFTAAVKWPNDVLIGELKVGGILSEVVDTPSGPAVVVGIGLNVAMTHDELPVPTATSLLVAAGVAPDRTDLLLQVLQTVWAGYQAGQAGGAEAARRLAGSYAEACVTIGQRVRVELPGERQLVGRATGIDTEGRLLVAEPGTATGVTAVGVGDVVHVRPA